jgi:hypothetical protein
MADVPRGSSFEQGDVEDRLAFYRQQNDRTVGRLREALRRLREKHGIKRKGAKRATVRS